MSDYGWRLPWNDEDVPHGLLDILRGCNISCRACYNTEPPRVKSLEEVQREFAALSSRRRLNSVSIVGGEPTLHPQLAEIARMIKAQGVSVELFTNGVLLDQTMLAELKAAGTDVIFLHADWHQDRPDVESRRRDDLRHLRITKAAAIAGAGMEAGLSLTAYDDALEEIDEAIALVLNSPHVDYLLVTLARDVTALGDIRGDLTSGMRGTPKEDGLPQRQGRPGNRVIFERLQQRFGLLPFAYLGSNVNAADPRWLSYMVGTVLTGNSPAHWAGLKVSLAEKTLLKMFRRVRGRYPFYIRQSPGRFRLQLLLGALGGGYFGKNLKLIVQSLGRNRTLRAKRLLFQNPAEVRSDGTVIHCAHCPDATVRHGRLVPVCIADRVVADC